ncbi:hypothetical protein FGRMN_10974 [Fusarium graminum]|nr:hypothetical protein FGRMN_10974 [Fusarium graminum]
MFSYLSPDQLPQGSSVTFYNSSFFKRCPNTPTLPTASEVLARPNYVQNPVCETMKLLQPTEFRELGLVVKYSENTSAIVAEGQCLWAIRRFLPEVPVPEVYGWTRENGIAFLYMEYIDGVTLNDCWGTLTATEKDSVCEQLKALIARMTCLRQTPNDQFIGSIGRGHLEDFVFTSTNFPPAGPFSSVTELHDCMSEMVKWPARMRQPDLDPTNILDPYREMLPDDSPIRFTHADLNPINIMVSKTSPCCIMAILDWEQSGWYPAYWEFCKAELTTEPHSEWQAVYLPKVLSEPDCCEGFYSYVNVFAP